MALDRMVEKQLMGKDKHPFKAIVLIGLVFALTSCLSCLSVRPVYNDKERAIAENAVKRFHELHNSQNVNAMYDLMEETVQSNEPKARTLEAMQKTIENTGSVRTTNLIEAKVTPNAKLGYTSRVNISYDTQFEKGEATEMFIWDIRNGTAQLFEYRIIPTAARR